MDHATFDPELAAVVDDALGLARARGFHEAGTHQLLWAALQKPDSAANKLLRVTRSDAAHIIALLESAVFSGVETHPQPGDPVLTPKARDALATAIREAGGRGATSAHLITGIAESRGVGSELLHGAGLTPQRIRDAIADLDGR